MKKRILLLAAVILLTNIFFAGTASALTVSPVKIDVTADPGQTVTGELTLLNEEQASTTFYSSFENFEAQGESGNPSFVPGHEGLASWVTAPEKVTLGIGEKKVIPFNIKVPADAEAGGHFAAVFWSTVPPEEGAGKVSVGAKVGTLLLLKVSGDIKEGGGILEFSSTDKKSVFQTLPISLFYRFQNSGSDRVKPIGNVVVKNMFGGTVATIDANPSEGNVLPSSVRKFTVEWVGNPGKDTVGGDGFFAMAKKEWQNFAFGPYMATLNVVYADKKFSAKHMLFIIPWQLLIILFFVAAVLICMFAFTIKRYNQWIIRRATGK